MGARVGTKGSVLQIIEVLDREHPDATLALDFDSPFQLLVALILAAQSTDAKINEITPALFAEFVDPAAVADAAPERLEEVIRSSGFFRQKARTLQGCARALLDKHGGEVPTDLEALLALPGVGRKTANILRGNAWGIPSIGVDTHVSRLSQRLGMTTQTSPDKIEAELVRQVPEAAQVRFCHLLQYHGRRTCYARKPSCPSCAVAALCPFPDKTQPEKPTAKATSSRWL